MMKRFCLAALIAATTVPAFADEPTLIILRAGPSGAAPDLIGFDALIGGPEIEQGADFGFLQESDDGYAISAVRVRTGPEGVKASDCVGGLAPSRMSNLFEGAYVCGEELPVPVSFQPDTGKLLPNLVDPNGTWAEEGFFVGTTLSVKITPAKSVAVAPKDFKAVAGDSEADLRGLIGRVSPDRIQKSGVCGDDVAAFFPRASLAGCADAKLFEN